MLNPSIVGASSDLPRSGRHKVTRYIINSIIPIWPQDAIFLGK